MKDTREIVAAVLTLVAAQTNQPLTQVMVDYEAALREVYELSDRLRDRLEHDLRARGRRPVDPGPPGGGGAGRPV
jgi:hypothetical protein